MTDDGPRVLVIDDNRAIHEDIRKILAGSEPSDAALQALEADLFGSAVSSVRQRYRVDSAFQGDEGLARVREALREEDPYAVAFVDVRMPPGWDGIETIDRIWREYSELQVVICTAYSDHSWTEIVERLGSSDSLLVLKKPFDPIELHQMASALTRKWLLHREDREKLRRANEDLRAANELLAEKSGALQSHLDKLRATQEQLIQAGKLAAIGQLAAGVAHEINNPLGVILGFAQGLERRVEEGHPLRLPVTSIVREALRCKNLVQELLTFSRAGKKIREITDLNALVRASVVLLETRARTQSVEIIEDLVEESPILDANKTQLQQVIVNLGTNALDAMPRGGTLTIRTRVPNEGEAELEISDTGTGISEEARSHIFEPFFTTKEVGRGTGLGLSLVYETVQQHGGTIDVQSRIGTGTTMTVRLPVRQGSASAA